MATDLGTLVYTLTLNDSGFTGQLDSASNQVKESSGQMTTANQSVEESSGKAGGAFKGMAGQFLAAQVVFSAGQKALQFVKGAISGATQAAKDWQTQQAQLTAALQSTHDISGVTREDAIRYAEALQSSTPISRDAALAGENMILTFTNIHKNTFPQTTKAIADMATAMNHGLVPNSQQLTTTAIMVGKALNDPAVGLTRLMRVGVEFTEQQKQQIKTMQAAGNMTGAQKVILDELSKEFGGRAAASLKTYQGQVDALKNKFNDLVGQGIQKLTVALEKVAAFLMQHKVLLAAVAGVVASLAILIGVVLVNAIWSAVAAMAAGLSPWLLLLLPIGLAIGAIAYEIITHWKDLKQWFGDFIRDVKQWFDDAVNFIRQHWQLLAEILLAPVAPVLAIFLRFHAQIIGFFQDIANFAHKAFNDIVGFIKRAFDDIVAFLKPIAIVILAIILLPLVPAVLAWRRFSGDLMEGIRAVGNFIFGEFNIIRNVVTVVFNALRSIATVVFDFIRGIVARDINAVIAVFDVMKNIVVSIFNVIKAAAESAFGFIERVFAPIVSFFGRIISAITNAIKTGVSNFGSLLYDAGRSLITGLINGVKSMLGDAVHTAEGLGKSLIDKAKSVLKIFSPSQVFSDIGTNVSLGLAKGISSSAHHAVNATSSMLGGVVTAGTQPIQNSTNNNTANQSIVYNIDHITLSTAEATAEFFAIQNRSTALELNGISPLAGTTRV